MLQRDFNPPAPVHIAALFAACVAGGLAGLMIVGTRDFALDDAWIHLVYARNLRAGAGLSYNPLDFETGFSSPLWALLLALWPISGNPVLPVKLLGALLHALTAFIATHLTAHLVQTRASDVHPLPLISMCILSGALVACAPTLVHGATSGMEIPLATAIGLAACWAGVRGHVPGAAAFGWLAVWARPELLVTCAVCSATLWTRVRTRCAGLGLLAGASTGMAVWMAYAWFVSGHVWPNAQYIKGQGGTIAGLDYVAQEVLPWQPWLISLGGSVFVLLAIRNCAGARALLLAYATTVLAIALTRPLQPGIEFFQTRYFAVVDPLPLVALPLGFAPLLRRHRAVRAAAWLGMAALAGLAGIQLRQLRGALVEQTEDTYAMHTVPGTYVAEHLPSDAVLGVEGAGASRFFTPPSMHIVDLVGLNFAQAAHAHADPTAKRCVFIRAAPTHLLVPEHWLSVLSPPFAIRVLHTFSDPHYTQVRPPRPLNVVLVEVGGVSPRWANRCGLR